MPSHPTEASPGRRSLLLGAAGAALTALALPTAPASAAAPSRARPFGGFGSPARPLTERTLYVHPGGLGDHTTVQAAVTAASGAGWTLVLAPGTYRETVAVGSARTDMTWIGASGDPRDVVLVYANAAGTPRPEGGTHGTTGSATTLVQAAGFTAHGITFANNSSVPTCRGTPAHRPSPSRRRATGRPSCTAASVRCSAPIWRRPRTASATGPGG